METKDTLNQLITELSQASEHLHDIRVALAAKV